MNRTAIAEALRSIVGPENTVTEISVLQACSADRFRKFETVHGVFTRPLPAAVVFPQNTQQVAAVLKFCNENGVAVIPKTGNSSIEGGLEAAVPDSVVVDGSRMDQVVKIDTENMLVTAQCGVVLETLETALREMGYTTGHSPQSKPIAQMGGLTATRSTGQFSTLYGGIEDMVVGLEAVFPDGSITRIKNVPRRASGPDIRQIIIGSEGALCFITEVTVKIFRYMPENNRFYSWLLDDMETGFAILREVMVQGYKPSFARLYDFEDGAYYFSHFCEGKPVLIFMVEGPAAIAKATGDAIEEIVAQFPTYRRVDERYIETWYAGLNWDTSKIEEEYELIRQTKNIGFTTEIAALWSDVYAIYASVVQRVKAEIPDITLMGGHSSHSYINGTNIYFMYYYDVVDCDVTEEIEKYHNPINKIIIEETLRHGGSVTHHHGVGKYRTAYMEAEHGSAYPIFKKLKETFDPNGIMNPGTLFPLEK